MATPAQYPFTGDGSRTVFPIPTKILGQEYIRVHIDGTPILDQTLYDIINNSIVFKTAPASATTLIVWVATDAEEIAELGTATNIDIVANNIDDIIVVANGINDITTVSSDAQLKAWESEAEAMTSASYATQVEDTVVYTYGSNGDGTFNAVATTDYSAYHWSQKASTFNPALYATLSGATFTGAIGGTSATFTGQVKGITPVANEDLTRKDYVDGKTESGSYVPSVVGGANYDSATGDTSYYQRVGNIVSIAGNISITATSIGTVNVTLTIPIASSITASDDANGIVVSKTEHGSVTGVSNAYIKLNYDAVSTSITSYKFVCQYIVK